MARPRNPNKQQQATPFEIAAAMAAEDASILKTKKVTYGAIEKAIALAKGFNSRFKTPEAFSKAAADLKAKGRAGAVGRAPASIGETRKYKVTKDGAIVISLKAYEWAPGGGTVSVHFAKDGPVVSKG